MKKLFEFTQLIECSAVIAAETEELARKELAGWSSETWVNTGELIGEKSEPELLSVREPKSPDLEDEAHVVV